LSTYLTFLLHVVIVFIIYLIHIIIINNYLIFVQFLDDQRTLNEIITLKI